MIVRQAQADIGIGVSFIISTVIHLAVFLLLAWWGSHAPPLTIQETYYVDIVNLPVAAPRAGSPSAAAGEGELAPPPSRLPEVPMQAPSGAPSAPAKGSKKTAAAVKNGSDGSEADFAERMARIEQSAESRHEEAVLQRLQSKLKNQGSGRPGMPAASGTQAGSDYMAYLQSRLKDAFGQTISYSSKNPEMAVRLFIDTDGKLSRRKAERSSGDRAFEISVFRAIDMASEKFTAPPNRKVFEGVFVFRPQGVSQNKP